MISPDVTLCQRSRSVRGTIGLVLADGTYDALVVDAHAGDDGTLHLEVTLTSGDHKGEVVHLRGRYPGKTDLDLLAAPATLTVTEGVPSLRLD